LISAQSFEQERKQFGFSHQQVEATGERKEKKKFHVSPMTLTTRVAPRIKIAKHLSTSHIKYTIEFEKK